MLTSVKNRENSYPMQTAFLDFQLKLSEKAFVVIVKYTSSVDLISPLLSYSVISNFQFNHLSLAISKKHWANTAYKF